MSDSSATAVAVSTARPSNKYDKMPEYVTTVYKLFLQIKSTKTNNAKRGQLITLVIHKYLRELLKIHKIEVRIDATSAIDLIPVFEYIAVNNIQLLNLLALGAEEAQTLNANNFADLERLALSHIYYLTQLSSKSR